VVTGNSLQSDREFVGRTDALDALQKGLNSACDGRGGLVMLSGEPGIGKTRCAEEFSRIAEGQGALVLWGRCYEQPGAPPYWPWVQILREYAQASSDDELRVLLGGNAEVVAMLVPELGERIGITATTAIHGEFTDQRFRLFDAVYRLLAKAAEEVPLILIIDDLHWADGSSLALLEHLSKELRRQQCLVVCTYRDVEVTRKSPLLGTLGELTRVSGIERLKLAGLSVEETAQLTTAVSGTDLPRSIIDAIYQQTDGNPLFVREVARVLAEQRLIETGDLITIEVPDGIREAIGRRLDQLSDFCNQLLTNASVIGREFDLSIVSATIEAELVDCIGELETAIQAGIIRREGDGSRYRFTHAVIRETLYEEIPTLERLQLHRAVADALRGAFEGNLDPVLSELVHHYSEASALGDHEVALDFATRAVVRDQRVYAYEEACRNYDALLRILRASGSQHDSRAAHALLEKGLLQLSMGHVGGALDSCTRGIGLAKKLSQGDLFDRYVGLMLRLTSFGPQHHAVALTEEALRLLPPDSDKRRAFLLACHAFALRSRGDITRVEKTGAQAIELARKLGDPYQLAISLRMVTLGLRGHPGTLPARLSYGREWLRISSKLEKAETTIECNYFHLLDLMEAGEVKQFTHLLESYAELAVNYNLARHLYQSELLRVVLALLHGDWQEAEQRIEQAYARGQQIFGQDRFLAVEGVYGAQMFVLNRELGRLRVMAPVVRRMIEDDGHSMWVPGLMVLCCEVGLLDQARSAFEKLASNDFSHIARDDMWVACMVFCAETCTRLGDASRASILYDALLPYAGQTASHPAAVCHGAVDSYLGMLAQTTDRMDLARMHYQRAIEMNRVMAAWPALARTQCRLAALLLAGTDQEVESGRGLLADAEQLATRFNMAGLQAEISEIRDGNATNHPDGLTPREVDVLRLLAIGRSNKDISMVLTISLSTVATHVRSILTKTGCANRTEAAAYAMREHLTENNREEKNHGSVHH
jgi:DNA-binding CsgD family transcriptional regulator/tetratricopeptide (TPR) repeat protein/ActR/RegA family two-component response regulator